MGLIISTQSWYCYILSPKPLKHDEKIEDLELRDLPGSPLILISGKTHKGISATIYLK